LYLDDGESIEQKGVSQIEFSYDGNKVVIMGDGEPAKFDIDAGLTTGWEKELKQ
jgi:hypothetical protein